ncbi:MAG: FAD-dependent monooxygenase [Acetobacteraceae bacterium]|nr:FAD-dependent monooxygenase [Acetobacteraceae bacterium]
MHEAPVIVGGGVAGGASAVLLARAGRRPLLLERERAAHDKVCGEFVSGEAARLLAYLGLDVAALGAAPLGRVRLAYGTRIAEAALPFAAWGLSRRRLDAALLDAAEREGAEVRRGVVVRGIGPDGAVLLPGEELRTGTVLLATGKHELRGAGREARSEALVGLKLHLRLARRQASRVADCVELHLVHGGYVGLQAVEDGIVNLCLIAPAARFGAAGRSAAALIEALGAEAPLLGARLGGAEALWPRPLAVARVPYGHLHRPASSSLPGVFRLGDQAAVIPSLTGDGMAIALHSAMLAAAAPDAGAYHRRLARDLALPMRVAGVLHMAIRAFPGMAAGIAAAFPGLLGVAARRTRVPEQALLGLAAENGVANSVSRGAHSPSTKAVP